MISKIWNWFRRPAKRVGWGPLVVIGGVLGAVFIIAGATVVDVTYRTEFCISCHEMRSTVYDDYKSSLHFDNPTGYRVECADCHIPKDWLGKLTAKSRTISEKVHSILGTINTPEKFKKRQLHLANRVWDRMIANDSRQCRDCHTYDAMLFSKQKDRKGVKDMREAMKDGKKTCIECHRGLVHELPEGYVDEYRKEDPDD